MCEFCGPDCKHKPVDEYDDNAGIDTMSVMVSRMFGNPDTNNGFRLLNRKNLWFDNSSGEYNAGMIEIKFCPFCGEKLD